MQQQEDLVTQQHVAVVGGGMAGLGAAWKLVSEGARVTLLDRNEDVGGRCRTFEWHGQWLIRGAAAFIAAEDNLVEQARALGIHTPAEVLDATQQHSWRIFHNDGEVMEVDDFKVGDILAASKIPIREKIALGRVLSPLLLQKARNNDRDPTSAVDLDTISACDYFRQYSPTFVDYILEPVMQMFCGYGHDDYSLAWLIWLMAGRFAWSSSWWTFENEGVGRLPRELGVQLSTSKDARVLTNVTATAVVPDDNGVEVSWLSAGVERTERFDGVVMAVPGSQVAPLMPELGASHRAFFKSVEYVGHHIIYAVLDLESDLEETSLLLPTAEGFRSLSNFHLRPDPEGYFLYGEIKGARCAELQTATDEEILEDALADLRRALPHAKIRRMTDYYVQRNDIALCRRHVGFTRALSDFKKLEPLPNVAFAGDYLLNSTVGQAHFTGLLAAGQLIERLGISPSMKAVVRA